MYERIDFELKAESHTTQECIMSNLINCIAVSVIISDSTMCTCITCIRCIVYTILKLYLDIYTRTRYQWLLSTMIPWLIKLSSHYFKYVFPLSLSLSLKLWWVSRPWSHKLNLDTQGPGGSETFCSWLWSGGDHNFNQGYIVGPIWNASQFLWKYN